MKHRPRGDSSLAAARRPDRPSWWQKSFLALFGLLLAILLLAALEGALALLGWGNPRLYEDPFVGFGEAREVFAKKTGADGKVLYATTPGKLSFFNDQSFPVEKADGTYRIFALGGSTTAGRPYDWKVSFPHWMQLYLDEMEPDHTCEVINAGAISYASYRIVVLMKELVQYSPDLFVIYTGHNEFLEERSYSDIIHQNLAIKKIRIYLSGFRFFTLARQAREALTTSESREKTVLAGEVEAKLDGWTGLDLYHRDPELNRSIVSHFEYNLHQMVRIARRHGADVIFIKPVSNLKDFSPFKSEHRASITTAERRQFTQAMERGRAHLSENRLQEALAAFEDALAIDSDFAEAHFRSGQSLLLLGEAARAREAFVRAKDLDVAPLRALEEITRLVSTVAQEYGLPAIDLPALLEAESVERYGHPILGDEYLQDHVHPSLPVHSMIAEKVIERLVEEGVVAPNPTWSANTQQEIYERLIDSIDSRYYAERDHNLAKVLAWSGKLEEAEAPLMRASAILTDNPEVHLNLGILYEKTGRHQEAVRELETVMNLDPGSPEAHFNLGTNYAYLGRLEDAIDSFQRAISLQENYPLAYFNLGIVYRRAGDHTKATEAFERAQQLRPDAPETPRNLGLTYREQNRFPEAIQAFEQALALKPDDLVALTELGIVYGHLGRFDEAMDRFEQALEIDPEYSEAHFNLAVVLAQRGDSDAAVSAYEHAIGADPDHSRAHNNLGIQYARRGELEPAQERIERAIEIDPEYAEAYLNLAVVYDQQRRPSDALQALRQGLEIAPDNVRMHQGISSLYEARGETDLARFHLQQADAATRKRPPGDS